MINFLLKNPSLYRFYQKIVRKKHDEYDFIKFIFKKNFIKKKVRMLDVCCGDSYILEYINEFTDDYMGIDNNDKYLNQCKKRWKKFNFISLDLNNLKNIDEFLQFNPNFIFINGAIHHLDDKTVKSTNSFIVNNFSDIKSNQINIIPYDDAFKLVKKVKNCDFVFNSRMAFGRLLKKRIKCGLILR